MSTASNFRLSVKRTIRLSIETASGKHRRTFVTIDRQPGDTDAMVMQKASSEYHRKHRFQSRIVALYV